MPIPLPELDDRRFADLVEEGRRLIPALAPSWTDHNPSDPGITLIELFAFVSELLMYRANRVSDANKRVFVQLLRGPKWTVTDPLDEQIRAAVLDLRDEQRAVTAADFVARAERVPGVARAWCLPRRNLTSAAIDAALRDAPAHVSVIVLPKAGSADPSATVTAELASRCLLTTRLHVVRPKYLEVRLNFTAYAYADRDEATVKRAILARLRAYFDPLSGGAGGHGWPLGRSLYISELLALLDTIAGVDYVTSATDRLPIEGLAERGVWEPQSTAQNTNVFVGLRLNPDELIDFLVDSSHIEVLRQPSLPHQE